MSKNSNIVPFGKYQGQPVERLAEDKTYCDWLTQQSWLPQRHPELYAVIINNFQEPTETPVHNAMQAKFLDADYCHAFMEIIRTPYYGGPAVFEDKGIDVTIHSDPKVGIELKPTMSDDYPAVLRQILRVPADRRCLVVGEYTGVGATYDQVTEIFARLEIHMIMAHAIDERLPHARQVTTKIAKWRQRIRDAARRFDARWTMKELKQVDAAIHRAMTEQIDLCHEAMQSRNESEIEEHAAATIRGYDAIVHAMESRHP